MKKKLSVTVEESVITQLDDKLQDGLLRNRSHLVELALKQYLRDKKDE